jgi:hypothetical protein
VDSRAGLDDVEKRKLLTLAELELRPLSPPAAIPNTLPQLIILKNTGTFSDKVNDQNVVNLTRRVLFTSLKKCGG